MALLRLAIVALILIARYNVEAWFFKGFASWLMPMKCHSDDGKIYFAGERVPSKNVCKRCNCSDKGEMMCDEIQCTRCPGEVVPVEGRCCGDCFKRGVFLKPGVGCAKCGFVYNFGDEIPTGNPCEFCKCVEPADIMCAMMSCAPCPAGHIRDRSDGTCCGRCRPPDCERDGQLYLEGQEITTPDPCETRHCQKNNKTLCALMSCAVCLGLHIQVNGSCCGECRPGCNSNGKFYDVGADVETEDPCTKCKCTNPGALGCKRIKCLPCNGKLVPVEGQCCSKCLPPDVIPGKGCVKDAVIYKFGARIKSNNPCEICTCFETSGIACAVIDCARCPETHEHVHVNGTCCGECHPCEWDGQTFKVGSFIDPEDKCSSCICHDDGDFTCEPISCPDLPPCRGKRVVTVSDQCCAQCKCRYKGNLVNPGTFGNKCDGCFCDGTTGKSKCSKPTCPDTELMCVDSVEGEDCCKYCPNGITCSKGNTVIKKGEKKIIGKKVCQCADPWERKAKCVKESD